jgi:hypothetical protein
MAAETWVNTFKIINEVSPTIRVDLCGFVGEPTLNDHLVEWLPIARELAPRVQIQITTNGTMLKAGKVTYADLLNAGANIIYTDQYGTHEQFEKLARESGYPFYQYYGPDGEKMPTPWKYYGPHVKLIVLMDHPGTWPKSRLRAGLLGNWYGNMNWDRGKRFGMKPVEGPLQRRCNQPFLYVTVAASGNYLLCCQDGLQVTSGKFGSVNEGMDGFKRFWFGQEMQTVRTRLRNKDRTTSYACAKCNITFSRCDFKHWSDDQVGQFWNGQSWQPLGPVMPDQPVQPDVRALTFIRKSAAEARERGQLSFREIEPTA